MKITLIRHTSVNAEPGICYGWSDIDVAPSFINEAQQVKQKIYKNTFDAVFSSPLLRCRKLANFCGYPNPIIDDRLKELNFGKWELQKWDEITDPQLQLWYNDWIHLPAGEAESYQEQCLRVANFLDEIRQKNYQHICIFTHRGVIACAMVYCGLCTVEDSFDTDVPYGSQTNIEL